MFLANDTIRTSYLEKFKVSTSYRNRLSLQSLKRQKTNPVQEIFILRHGGSAQVDLPSVLDSLGIMPCRLSSAYDADDVAVPDPLHPPSAAISSLRSGTRFVHETTSGWLVELEHFDDP